MNATVKIILVPTIICAVCSAVLAAVNGVTLKPIQHAIENKSALAASKVMPTGLPLPEKRQVNGVTFFVAMKDGKVAGVATVGDSANGYGGHVKLMVGMSADNKLVGYEIVEAGETPGLGMKMTTDKFKKPLLGRLLGSTNWHVKKDGGDIDAITAATITSRAVMDCIRDAIEKRTAAKL